MANIAATNRQVPDHSILDHFRKQVYLGNQYVYAVSSAIASTSETPLILLSNPAGTGIGLFNGLRKLLCVTASQSAIVRVYLNPTVTGAGSAQTPVQLRPANTNAAVATVGLSPTVSANGTLIDVLSSLPGMQGYSDLMTILDQAQSLLVTVQTTANPTTVLAELSWYEI